MGYYINPTNMSKEQWLRENGVEVPKPIAKHHPAGDELVVCLVDNGAFTAAGIAYDDGERDAFMYPDSRPMRWYLVKRELLKEWL
jgi:hypothetical protein